MLLIGIVLIWIGVPGITGKCIQSDCMPDTVCIGDECVVVVCESDQQCPYGFHCALLSSGSQDFQQGLGEKVCSQTNPDLRRIKSTMSSLYRSCCRDSECKHDEACYFLTNSDQKECQARSKNQLGGYCRTVYRMCDSHCHCNNIAHCFKMLDKPKEANGNCFCNTIDDRSCGAHCNTTSDCRNGCDDCQSNICSVSPLKDRCNEGLKSCARSQESLCKLQPRQECCTDCDCYRQCKGIECSCNKQCRGPAPWFCPADGGPLPEEPKLPIQEPAKQCPLKPDCIRPTCFYASKFTGQALESFGEIGSARDCWEECHLDQACLGFTWSSQGYQCTLLATLGRPQASSSHISGFRLCPDVKTPNVLKNAQVPNGSMQGDQIGTNLYSGGHGHSQHNEKVNYYEYHYYGDQKADSHRGQSNGLTDSKSSCFLENTSIDGDLTLNGIIDVDNASKCQELCQKDPSCEYFTMEVRVCYLMKNKHDSERYDGATSGSKRC